MERSSTGQRPGPGQRGRQGRHVLVVTIPAWGHTNPILEGIRELVRRGHRVTVWATRAFTPAIREVGAEPVTYDSPLDPAAADPRAMNRMPSLILEEASSSLAALERLCAQDPPDCIVHDVLAWAGWILGRRLAVPAVQTWPIFASNEVYSPHQEYVTFDPGDAAMLRFFERAAAFLRDTGLDDMSVDEFFRHISDRNLVLFPRELQPRGATFDDRFVFVGPCIRAPEPWADEGWLGSAKPLLVVSLGTVYNDDLGFYRACVEAVRSLGWSCAMSIGHKIAQSDLPDLPGNLRVWRRLPLVAALRHAAVFVTQGGVSGTVEALYHGVPLVVAPQMGEQAAVADRIAELGLGVRLPDGFDAGDLARSVRQVDGDRAMARRLHDMRRVMRATGGAARFADEIERDIGSPVPVPPTGRRSTRQAPARLVEEERT